MQRIVQSTASFSAAMEEKWPGSIVVLLITPVNNNRHHGTHIHAEPIPDTYSAKITIYSSEDCAEENRLAGPFESNSWHETQKSAVTMAAMMLLHAEDVDVAVHKPIELTWRFRI
ncbi:MAG: hypothetical protein WC052_04325 [Patescibacteria group bacterium]